MSREKMPLTAEEFEVAKEELFGNGSDALRAFANNICEYCWRKVPFAVVQEWGGRSRALLAFGVPIENRIKANAKNYLAIYRIEDVSAKKVKCEVIFPKDKTRLPLIEMIDSQRRLSISSINETEGWFGPSDETYLRNLIDVSYAKRFKPGSSKEKSSAMA